MTYKLIVCDIDGTLVNEEREFSSYSAKVINKVRDKGYLFGIASGRPVMDVEHLFKSWNLNKEFDFVIGMNGTELYDGNKMSTFYTLKREWIKDIIDFMSHFDFLNPFIYKDDYMLSMRIDEAMMASSKRNEKEVKVAKDASEFWESENAKVLFRMSTDVIDEVEAYAKAHINGPYIVFKTQPTMLEFAHEKTDKANALKEYCKEKNIKLDEVIAFGDSTNDDGMLKASGLGIAMQNAIPTTKAIADLILDKSNEEDGVADYIEKHLL